MFVIILGIFSGLLLGITGGGGAIISVPILIYAMQIPIKTATTMSLLVVAVSAIFGTLLRYKDVYWRNGFIFAIISSITSVFGVKLAQLFTDTILILSFATLMLCVAIITLSREINKKTASDNISIEVSFLKIIPLAALVGLLTGLFGVGGGFIIVPTLVFMGRLQARVAVATSLFIVSLLSIFSLINKIYIIKINFSLTSLFILGSIIGMLLGSIIAKKITNRTTQIIFGSVCLLLGIFMIINIIVT